MKDGSVVFVDIIKEGLYRLHPNGEVELLVGLPGGPNGLAVGPDGAAYVCNNGGVYLFAQTTEPDGIPKTVPLPNPAHKGGWIERVDFSTSPVTVTRLFDSCDGVPLIAPDDIVFDKSGGFYFTDTGKQTAENWCKGGVFYVSPDRKISRLAQIFSANGIGLSPQEDRLYVSDTIFGRLWMLKLLPPAAGDPTPGVPKLDIRAPGMMIGVPGTVLMTLPGLQWVDSLKVEADGSVCVGTLLHGCLTVWRTDGSIEQLGDAMNDMMVTNLCFGGADMCTVWVTASTTGKIYRTRWPRPGLPLHSALLSGHGGG